MDEETEGEEIPEESSIAPEIDEMSEYEEEGAIDESDGVSVVDETEPEYDVRTSMQIDYGPEEVGLEEEPDIPLTYDQEEKDVEEENLVQRIDDKALGDEVEKLEEEEEEIYGLDFRLMAEPDKKKRKSSAKKSIQYDFVGRVTEEQRISRQISGDFERVVGDPRVLRKLFDVAEIEEEEEEDDSDLPIWRKFVLPTGFSSMWHYMIDKVRKFQEEKAVEMIRSAILQIKISKYLRRRNMEYCLREIVQPQENYIKYKRKLDELGQFYKRSKISKESLIAEIKSLTNTKEKKGVELDSHFKEFQSKVSDAGRGLIYAKTGSTISDRVVDIFLNRQKNSMANLAAMRLHFIQFRNTVTAKEEDIKKLDHVDSKYTLMYYEKLKAENRSHTDKIEEKETELAKFRKDSVDTMQILSHVREKSSALTSDITDLKEVLIKLGQCVVHARHELNDIKKDRDIYRSLTVILQNEAGLLLQPALLRDMETSLEQYHHLKKKLDNIKQEFNTKMRQLRNARKTREAILVKAVKKKKATQASTKHKVSKSRLSVKVRKNVPRANLANGKFDQLMELKPIVTVIQKDK